MDEDGTVVHEEERTRVLPDGTLLREVDRVDSRSRFRESLPWLLSGLLGLVLVAGVAVWYVTRSSTKPVPAVVGLRIDAAVTRLQQDGFKAQIARQANARPTGVVFGQNPAATSKADSGSLVRVLVSNGVTRATVMNAVGLSQGDARSRLVQAGFEVTTVQVFSAQPLGLVVAQAPTAGDRVAPGTKVRLNVSKGSGSVNVPSEVGNSATQAQSDIAAAGLKPLVTQVPSAQPVDTVVAQTPTGGQARKGSTVELSVSQGPGTTTAPAPTATTGTTGSPATTTSTTTTTP